MLRSFDHNWVLENGEDKQTLSVQHESRKASVAELFLLQAFVVRMCIAAR